MHPEAESTVPEIDAEVLTPARDLRRFSHRYGAGEVVFEQGAPGRCMYVVLSGAVEIRQIVADGISQTVINTLLPGECFGEIALLEDGTRMACALARDEPTVLVEIDKARFIYLIGQQPAFALTVMRGLAKRVEGRGR